MFYKGLSSVKNIKIMLFIYINNYLCSKLGDFILIEFIIGIICLKKYIFHVPPIEYYII